MPGHDFLAEMQPNATAVAFVAGEWRKDILPGHNLHAGAVVAHGYIHTTRIPLATADGDGAAGRHGLKGVVHHIQQHPPQVTRRTGQPQRPAVHRDRNG